MKGKSSQFDSITFSQATSTQPRSAKLGPGVNSEKKYEEIRRLTVFTLDQNITHEGSKGEFRAYERLL